MKPLLVLLLLAISVQAQSIADAARQERERQAKLKATVVIKETGPTPPAAGTPGNQVPKLNAAPAPDPVEVWNAKVDQLRTKIKDLQEQEIALQLQQTQLQNQVFAPVTDPSAKDQAQAAVAQNVQDLGKVREDLDTSKKELDQMMAGSPPKK